MSNLRLKDHTWDAANVYDSALGKTQEQINAEVGTSLAGKQGTLVSGENIKTVNGASILGSGNIKIQGGGGSSVVVDDTLSIAGAAADAKKTGDELSDLKSAVNRDYAFDAEIVFNFNEHKFIGNSTGKWTDNTSYPMYYSEQAYTTASAQRPFVVTMNNSAMKFRMHLYSNKSESDFISSTEWVNGAEKVIINGNYKGIAYNYIRFTVSMEDGTYSTAIFDSLVAAFTTLQKTDIGLTLRQAAADAKATGDRFTNLENYKQVIVDPAILHDITNISGFNFSSSKFIGESSGNYQTNSGYPYLFGEQFFYRVRKESPIAITMGSDDFKYLAFFYSYNESSYFIAHDTWHDGSEVTYYDGEYNGNQYNYIRFDIYRTDHSYTESDFEACVSAFNVKTISEYGVGNPQVTPIRFFVRTNLAWPDTESTAVDTEETENNVNVRCILTLPDSYRQNGKPVPLIMLCHGASAHVSNSYWYNNGSDITTLVNAFRSAGYGVFDVDNTRDDPDGYPDWGGLPLMTAYIHAWEYIKQNYNVEKKLYLYSMSMGTCVNLNMMKWYPGDIVASIMSAPRPFCKYRYDTIDDAAYKAEMAESFGLGVSGEWDTERLRGFCHYDNIIEINDVKYVPEKFPPCKVMVGKSDTSFIDETREYYQALSNSCNFVNYREVTGMNHQDMTFLTDAALRAEAISWFDRFRDYSEVVSE